MIGIISCGAYIPKWRMAFDLIAKGAPGERTVAGPDEDSVTMASAAALNCLKGVDRNKVDGLFFATTTSPFNEKQMAVFLTKVAGLRPDIMTADFGGSTRAGTTAIKLAADTIRAGSAKQILVVASDCRIGAPGSEHERNGGDGAAAILLGDERVAVSLESSVSVTNEIFDVWRRSKDIFLNSWESRFDLMDGYSRSMREAIGTLMKQEEMSAKDFAKAVFYCPDARTPVNLAKGLGFDPKNQLQNPLFGTLGNAGAAGSLLLLVAALEEVKPGDNILVAGYGSGSDAMTFKAHDGIREIKNKSAIKNQIKSKLLVPDYFSYLKWRGLVADKEGRISYWITYASSPSIYREQDRIFSLYGSKCNDCGAIQYPPQRVCAKCQSKDNSQNIPLADKKGTIFSFSKDPITGQVVGLVNFEGGGRILCNFTDGDFKDFKIGMPVEMCIRKLELLSSDTISSYTWKAISLRDN